MGWFSKKVSVHEMSNNVDDLFKGCLSGRQDCASEECYEPKTPF